VSLIVLGVNVRLGRQKRLDRRNLTRHSSTMQRRPSVIVCGVNVRLGRQKRLDRRHLALDSSQLQRRHSLIGLGVNVRFRRQKRLDRRHLANKSSHMQRRLFFIGLGVNIRLGRQKRLDCRHLALLNSQMQRRHSLLRVLDSHVAASSDDLVNLINVSSLGCRDQRLRICSQQLLALCRRFGLFCLVFLRLRRSSLLLRLFLRLGHCCLPRRFGPPLCFGLAVALLMPRHALLERCRQRHHRLVCHPHRHSLRLQLLLEHPHTFPQLLIQRGTEFCLGHYRQRRHACVEVCRRRIHPLIRPRSSAALTERGGGALERDLQLFALDLDRHRLPKAAHCCIHLLLAQARRLHRVARWEQGQLRTKESHTRLHLIVCGRQLLGVERHHRLPDRLGRTGARSEARSLSLRVSPVGAQPPL